MTLGSAKWLSAKAGRGVAASPHRNRPNRNRRLNFVSRIFNTHSALCSARKKAGVEVDRSAISVADACKWLRISTPASTR